MANNDGNVELLTVEKLRGMKFRIPAYQRGYRWRKAHVRTLLEDLDLFKQELEIDSGAPRVYSMQPLVVKKMVPEHKKCELLKLLREVEGLEVAEELFRQYWEWEVIDGQQRLTTLYLLLTFLGSPEPYLITYDTRDSSQVFLSRFAHLDQKMEDDAKTNIDFCRMNEVYQEIKAWFSEKDDGYKETFCKLIHERVQFIWYESVGEKAIEVFTRLNIGNIKLTDAELIKALILDQASFLDAHGQRYRNDAQLKLARGKISSEWDEIECRLQDDSFWLYLQPWDEKKKKLPTRIDFLLQLATTRTPLAMVNTYNDDVYDDHKLFHLYEKYFRTHRKDLRDRAEAREQVWKTILDMYHVLEEWFEDSKLYHYTGYLMAVRKKELVVGDLLDEWYKAGRDRDCFVEVLKNRIRHSLDDIRSYAVKQSTTDDARTLLDVVYDEKGCPPKGKCTPLLLLHNVLTVVQLGKFMSEKREYRGQRVFYKFPFNLYKREDWEIEHVTPRTDNQMDDPTVQKDWLLSAYPYVSDELKSHIEAFCDGKSEKEFSDLRDACAEAVEQGVEKLTDDDDAKNKIWNFVLLDGGTNSGYGNSLFPAKRRTIMFKEQGVRLKNLRFSNDDVNRTIVWDEEVASSPFVPLCTKHVFLQYYSGAGVSPLVWSKADAQCYYDNLKKVLEDFLKDPED